MQYTFKQVKLSDVERLWLSEIVKLNFSIVDVNSLKIKLWSKLPKDFDPNTIDNRLIRNNRLTLIGLWHVDPQSVLFNHVSKTIGIIRDLILKNPGIKSISANEIAAIAGMTERDAEIALKLIYDLGGFFGSAAGSSKNYGYKDASFQQNDSAYDEFLRFESLEQKMEQFFVRNAPISNVKVRKSPKSKFTRSSDYPVMKQSTVNTWDSINNDFDITKQAFIKKINFVTDKFKRSIILRDIEHAYVLMKGGFSKPAVILAGGVIEELLRLYLESKSVNPGNNTFDEYIKACAREKLLKEPINSLSNSVRHFRNLVHLAEEESERHTISKATAQGAVSSIFTIVNDF